MCNGYRGWITTTNQGQLIYFFNMSPGEHPLRAALKPRYMNHNHTIHQASEEIISQRIDIHKYNYSHNTYYYITSVRDGQPSQTTASVYVSGLRLATSVGCAGLCWTTSGLLRTTPDYFRSTPIS